MDNKEEENDANNPDQKFEPSCSVVMSKCSGELLAILLYCAMLFMMMVGLIHHLSNGKPLTALIEFGVALLIDQVKSLPLQFIIWWVVIRRCGKFEPDDFKEWDDEKMLEGGVDMSLF